MQPVLDRGDDAEVAAAASQAPEQVGVLLLGRAEEMAVGGDDVEGQCVVAGESEPPAEASEAAAKREPGRARVRYRTGRCRKSESGALVVELGEQGSGLEIRA